MLTVVETTVFQKRAESRLSEQQRKAFIDYIAYSPLAGAIIPGAGGLRKVRWSAPGRGKRGGVRIIYYYLDDKMPVYLLDIYAKNEQADLSASDKATLAKLAQELKRRRGRR